MARELSPEYDARVNHVDRLRGLIGRVEKAMQHREDAAIGNERAAELRWRQLNPAQKTLHVAGVLRDPQFAEYERAAGQAQRSHHRLGVRRGTLTGQLNVNERLAVAALDKVRPEAERILLQRQQTAEAARAALAAERQATRKRDLERKRTRGSDYDIEDQRTQGHHRGRGRGHSR